jgi:hypothetical protein
MDNYIIEKVSSCTNCNNSNIKNYNPYYIEDDILYVDKEWYFPLLDLTKERLQKIIDNYKLKLEFINVDVPHNKIQIKYESIYTDLYKIYLWQYDYENWYNDEINDDSKVKIIKIPRCDANTLDEWTDKYFTSLSKNDLDDLSYVFKNEIISVIEYFRKNGIIKFFVKLSGTSGKNDHDLIPLFDIFDIIKFISQVSFKKEYKKMRDKFYDTNLCLIIMPWNDMFDNKRYEFRAFMYNNKITCISQQVWYDIMNYSEEELKIFKDAVLSFENKTNLKNATIDMYIKDGKIHVIEYNPFGPYSAAGSSLFNWINDFDKMHNKDNNIYFRLLE